MECPVETLDIPDSAAGMLDGTNIIGLYSRGLQTYQTLLSCTFSLKEADTMCRNLLNTNDIITTMVYTDICAPAD